MNPVIKTYSKKSPRIPLLGRVVSRISNLFSSISNSELEDDDIFSDFFFSPKPVHQTGGSIIPILDASEFHIEPPQKKQKLQKKEEIEIQDDANLLDFSPFHSKKTTTQKIDSKELQKSNGNNNILLEKEQESESKKLKTGKPKEKEVVDLSLDSSREIAREETPLNGKILFKYPLTSEKVLAENVTDKGRVAISEQDVSLLNPGEFLNDSIIEFYLKCLALRILQRDPRFYFFNSFFYKTLSNSMEATSVDKILKWTKKVDIFSKEYIIVPINESLHWILAIICFPGTADKTQILIFDSLGRPSHATVCNNLRKFLELEWNAKHFQSSQEKRLFTPKQIPSHAISAPQQDNYCDCGIFVLHYAEMFCRQLPKWNEINEVWFPLSDIKSKRDEIKALIYRIQIESQVEYAGELSDNGEEESTVVID